MLFEQCSKLVCCRLSFHGDYGRRHELTRRAGKKLVHRPATTAHRYSLDSLVVPVDLTEVLALYPQDQVVRGNAERSSSTV